MCETLMPDVMVPEAHQSNWSYVRELSGLTFNSLCKNLAWWAVARRTSHKTVKIGGWALGLDNTVVFEVRPLPCILNITDVIRHSLFFFTTSVYWEA